MKRVPVALLVALLLGTAAWGRVAAPPPIPFRVATTEILFVGKVTGVSEKLVPAEIDKDDPQQMQVATVEVKSALMGKVSGKVEVGYFPSMGRRPGVSVQKGDEAIFFVRKHPSKKNVYVAELYYSVLNKRDNPQFAAELAQVKAAAEIVMNPSKALLSRLLADRETAAGLLITRYRTPTVEGKQEVVPTAESKAILQALAEAEWAPGRVYNPMSARIAFNRLGLTAKDGWTPPAAADQFTEAAKKWLKENAGTYKMMRYVRDEGKRPEEP